MTDSIPSWLDPATLRWVADALSEDAHAADERQKECAQLMRHATSDADRAEWMHASLRQAGARNALSAKRTWLRKLATRREREG